MNLTEAQTRYVEVELGESLRMFEHVERNIDLALTRTPRGNLLYDRLELLRELATNLRRELRQTKDNAKMYGTTQESPGRL